jgi:hypothetical protein
VTLNLELVVTESTTSPFRLGGIRNYQATVYVGDKIVVDSWEVWDYSLDSAEDAAMREFAIRMGRAMRASRVS